MHLLSILPTLGLLIAAALWVWLALNPAHRQAFRVMVSSDRRADGTDLPPVAIIVAARNEALMLPQTIPTLCRQSSALVRVILVDDQSEDESLAILETLCEQFANLQVIAGQPRPPAWMGKPWAVQQGSQAVASGAGEQWLLFTDADCEFHPLAVAIAQRWMVEKKLDVLTLLPRPICQGPWEQLGVAALGTMLLLLFPIGWCNNPRRSIAVGAGPFILARRAVYDAIGGHAAVANCIVEDINLVRRLKASGARVAVHLTDDLVTTRMYDGLADLWEGLTKNAYAGMEYQPRKFWVGQIVSLLLGVLPPIYLLMAIVSRHWLDVVLAAVVCAAMVIIHYRTIRWMRLPAWHALLLPASVAFYMVICAASFVQHHLGGGNVWKGRRYAPSMLQADTVVSGLSSK